jgi:hypothetical protein
MTRRRLYMGCDVAAGLIPPDMAGLETQMTNTLPFSYVLSEIETLVRLDKLFPHETTFSPRIHEKVLGLQYSHWQAQP